MGRLKQLLSEKDWHYLQGFSKGKDFKNGMLSCIKSNGLFYTKKPFSGVKSVINYLGRYAHEVPITNQRIE
ncbi:MAG: hypothetical protein ACI8Q1_002074 [Parvicella sp.]|jgi:hypothetical protein